MYQGQLKTVHCMLEHTCSLTSQGKFQLVKAGRPQMPVKMASRLLPCTTRNVARVLLQCRVNSVGLK
jgi:hypothetical protein